jgi:hypothetical protein
MNIKQLTQKLKSTNQDRLLTATGFFTLIGFVLVILLLYTGVYKPDLYILTLCAFTFLTITFGLMTYLLIISVKLNRKILWSIILITVALSIIVISIDSIISLIKFGLLKCPTCP